jgi:AcrR family transcriptional regulator
MPRLLTPSDVTQFRNHLCEVGAELFAEQGAQGFHMRELAKRLGVSAMTPYRYFKDKEAILVEVRTRAFARFADWLEEQLSRSDADDSDALGRAYAQFAIQKQTLYRLMFDLAQQSAAPPAQAAQEMRAREIVMAHVRTLASRGLVNGDPDVLGLLLWSTLHGITALYLTGKLSGRDLDRTLSQAVRAFVLCSMEQPQTLAVNMPAEDLSPPWQQIKSQPVPQVYEASV